MRNIVESFGVKDALYLIVEPGDATRYTVFYYGAVDYPFVAIGPGDKIEGGYWVPSINYMLKNIKECAEKGESVTAMLVERHVGYWGSESHSGVKNEWTCIVAILVAAIIQRPDLDLRDSDLIRNIYLGNNDGILEELALI